MESHKPSPPDFECRNCRTPLPAENLFCATCGAQREPLPTTEELRSIQFLLIELARWESQEVINNQQARTLRQAYERRREELHAQLNDANQSARKSSAPQESTATQAAIFTQNLATQPATRRQKFSARLKTSERLLLDAPSDQHTLRLLLYTGAAMVVVGIVIWLRDVLYLKLQEPIVQASLLALGTLIATAAGWYAILRTRQRLTGRALTLIGSLLVPVNFWFLVRSGLISNNGRAWIVCAFCAMLYAHTAALLREKLYVYLAAAASIATLWAIIFRVEREAYGLYALALMIASLIMLHLSRVFPSSQEANKDNAATINEPLRETHEVEFAAGRWARELWSTPFVHVALAGACISALCYMPLRLSPSLDDNIFRLRANDYDPGVALLLFAGFAYAAWYAGRYVYTIQRAFFYTCTALALCWMELLLLDAAHVSGLVSLLFLSLTALALGYGARLAPDESRAKALHRAGVLASIALALVSLGVSLLSADAHTWTHAATLFILAAAFAVQSASRFDNRLTRALLAYAATLMLATLVALHSDAQWFAALFMLALFPSLFVVRELARERRRASIERFAFDAAGATALIAFIAMLLQAMAHLRVGDALLFAPCVTAAEIGVFTFLASALLKKDAAGALYFRVGLSAGILSFMLACLRAGYDPVSEVEIYTTPVAIVLLAVAYVFVQRERRTNGAVFVATRQRDASLLLWLGSLLLCAPLCLRAFDARLIEGVAAPWRDVATLCAALALLLFGVMARLRAPVGIGSTALIAELLVLASTSVDWAQVPLKIYLVTTGALIVFVCWCLEFRREQLLLVRQRINASRMAARERFGAWR